MFMKDNKFGECVRLQTFLMLCSSAILMCSHFVTGCEAKPFEAPMRYFIVDPPGLVFDAGGGTPQALSVWIGEADRSQDWSIADAFFEISRDGIMITGTGRNCFTVESPLSGVSSRHAGISVSHYEPVMLTVYYVDGCEVEGDEVLRIGSEFYPTEYLIPIAVR